MPKNHNVIDFLSSHIGSSVRRIEAPLPPKEGPFPRADEARLRRANFLSLSPPLHPSENPAPLARRRHFL